MNIGHPKRVIEVEPASEPLPDPAPAPVAPQPASDPAHATQPIP